MLEKDFKRITKWRIKEMFPDCFIHEMMCQFGSKWALLEFKKSKKAPHRPNQEYYVNRFNKMGYSAFIYPENADYILQQLKEYFYEQN